MLKGVVNVFLRKKNKDPKEGKDVTDIINDLEGHLSVAQINFEILKKFLRSTRQGSAGIGQSRRQMKPSEEALSRIDMYESNEFVKNEQHEHHNPMGTDESDNPSDIHLEMVDEMEAVNKLEEGLKNCLDSLDNYKRKRLDKTITSNKIVAIQLYCAQKTPLTNYAMLKLQEKLENQLAEHGIELKSELCTKPDCLQSGKPLIVICLSSTRLDEDFENAVTGAPIGPNTAVLIFHHMRQHALPTIPSKTQLGEDKAKNVGLITDVAFFDTMGLYDCDMNTNAYKSLLKFIDSHF